MFWSTDAGKTKQMFETSCFLPLVVNASLRNLTEVHSGPDYTWTVSDKYFIPMWQRKGKPFTVSAHIQKENLSQMAWEPGLCHPQRACLKQSHQDGWSGHRSKQECRCCSFDTKIRTQKVTQSMGGVRKCVVNYTFLLFDKKPSPWSDCVPTSQKLKKPEKTEASTLVLSFCVQD